MSPFMSPFMVNEKVTEKVTTGIGFASCCIPVVFLLGGPNSIDCVAVAHCIDILGLINNTVSDSMTYVKYSDEGVNFVFVE